MSWLTPSLVRRLTAVFFVVYLVALTYPVYSLFRHPTPFVLGLPLSLVWVALWVLLGWKMLILLYFVEQRSLPPPAPPPPGERGEQQRT